MALRISRFRIDMGANPIKNLGQGTSTTDAARRDEVVLMTGDQTVAGVKTFSSFPVTPSSAPTTDYQIANKKYVIDSAGVTPTNTVTLTNKTLTSPVINTPTGDVLNSVFKLSTTTSGSFIIDNGECGLLYCKVGMNGNTSSRSYLWMITTSATNNAYVLIADANAGGAAVTISISNNGNYTHTVTCSVGGGSFNTQFYWTNLRN